ncbi:MAG: EAL domain-containing protein [Gammaproteobacteria bacterium]|nr:EAL domain-containing protein [Gammaproteobacteria bacterium]
MIDKEALDKLIHEVLDTIGISPEDIIERKIYLDLANEDIATLQQLRPALSKAHERLMETFYAHLLSFDATAEFLTNPQQVEQLKQKQSSYFNAVLSGEYDMDYVTDRLRVGITHHHIGLEPRWYFGAYSKYICSLLPEIWQAAEHNSELAIKGIQALLKVVFLDIELAIHTYMCSDTHRIEMLMEYAENLICNVPSGLVVLDSELRVLSVNRFMDRLFFEDHESLKGRTIDELFPGMGLRDRANEVLTSIKGQRGVILSCKDIHDNNIYFEFAIIPMLQTGSHEPLDTNAKLLIIIEDLTEQENLREQTLTADQRVRAIMDNVSDGIITIDERGNVESFNASAEKQFGYSAAEIIGKNVKLLMPEPYQSNHDGYLERYQASGERRCLGFGFREVEGKRKDGSTFPMELSISEMSLHNQTYYIGMVRDITERKVSETEMSKLSHAVEQTADSIIITDKNGLIEYVNTGFEQTTGYQRDEVIGCTPNVVKSGEMSDDFYTELWKQVLSGEVFRDIFVNKKKDGSVYFEEKTITPLRDINNQITHFISSGKDITDRMRTQERLQYLAHHDVLTGLPNRLLFMDRLAQAMKQSRREGEMVALMFLDIDRFKNINDTLGHQTGDTLLRIIAKRLSGILRDHDTVARLSGDEFAVLLSGINTVDVIPSIARKILLEVSHPVQIREHELFVTTSIGISVFPDDGSEQQVLLKNADSAMYHAKQQGKNNYQFYTPDMNAMAAEYLALENKLHRALERSEFEINYQPQFNIQSGKLNGIEALIRWRHPEEGLLQPDRFIHLLEDTGLIVPIGEWILYTACYQFSKWINSGLLIPKIAVNITPRQLACQNFVSVVEQALKDTGLQPHQLELEITESSLMEEQHANISALHDLHAMGVSIAMDDFGTGYSSLSYLRQFPIQTLKIDRSFVKQLPENHDDCVLARTIISMGQNLNLNIIAEGVETSEQLEFLRNLGCDDAQGFLYSPAIPAELLRESFLINR